MIGGRPLAKKKGTDRYYPSFQQSSSLQPNIFGCTTPVTSTSTSVCATGVTPSLGQNGSVQTTFSQPDCNTVAGQNTPLNKLLFEFSSKHGSGNQSNANTNLNTSTPSTDIKQSQSTKDVPFNLSNSLPTFNKSFTFAVKEKEQETPTAAYDELLELVIIDESGVNRKVKSIENLLKSEFKKPYEIAWLLRVITCIDLTTLGGDDTDTNVSRLCYKAIHPLSDHLLNLMNCEFVKDITTAAVCIYPARVAFTRQCLTTLAGLKKVALASVATGFPSGQYPLDTKLNEINYCVVKGADEIDVVVSRELVIANDWAQLYDELKRMKSACGSAHMKTILATGECGSLANVYKASIVAMAAGTDFIKTSTGKETVNATLQVGVVMCRAIRDFYDKTGKMVGLKPAGGIKTSSDALAWLVLVKEMLGNEWLNSKLFRIGASGLLADIEKRLFYLIKGYRPSKEYFFAS